ncbi:hypothetical protein GCM10022219_22860 [Microbacterium oryzae]|uniref:GGDEF domain-containing protein n=1 Tax=Microbacterium oryzae TaxID=743009 RepID=A0A6I6DR92_9MICO|nr:hypothetical protein [Microbacterium oryzae]QGU27495.1 hypothetical protein D7D94_07315 [Microbacterium oryzae]
MNTTVPFIAVATVACIIMIGLGFLPRPSYAAAHWSLAFVLAMNASYTYLYAETTDYWFLPAYASGIFLPANAFLWTGLRFFNERRRSGWSWATVYLVASPTVLILLYPTPYYSMAFRLDFLVSCVFAVLCIAELLKLYPRVHEAILPMVVAAAIFPVFAVYGLLDGLLRWIHGNPSSDDLATVRAVNGVGTSVYIVCVLITLLLIVRQPRAASARTDGTFEAVAKNRLERAQKTGDDWWSLIDVRLDDPEDIRTALGGGAFEEIAERFCAAVNAGLPADADIEQRGETRFVALVPRSSEAARRLIVSLLERIGEPDPDHPLPVRTSASIGWATVAATGYDLDALLTAASDANAAARQMGGDRWERAGKPDVVTTGIATVTAGKRA